MLRAALIIILLTGGGRLVAEERDPPALFGAHPGYTNDVEYEKSDRSHEMVMLDKPKEPERPLTEIIFNEKLSREFQQQYEYRFGVTQAEQVINSPGRYDEYTYNTGRNATLKEYRRDQQKFGEYMTRRLFEYHVDNYAKQDRSFKSVYKFKERVSNLDVKTKKGWKFKWKYNISGPTMDVNITNPYDIETKVRVEMSGIASAPTEVIAQFAYFLTPRVKLSALIKTQDGIYQLVGSRRLTRHTAVSLTGSIDTRAQGPTVQQNIVLVGFSWSE